MLRALVRSQNVSRDTTWKWLSSSPPRLITYGNEIDHVQYAKLLGVAITNDLTWNKHVAGIVAKAGKKVYMLYQLKRAGIGQHDLVTIILYVSVIRPVLEYACPVWNTNPNKHLTESIETVQKRALQCIYPGNEYADILCLTSLPCLKERRDSLCKKYFQNIMGTTHRLNYLLLVRYATSMMYGYSISTHYPKSVRIYTATH